MLQITDVTYRIEGRLLLDQATAAIPPGHRVGLVGRNGAGKSTLFRMITGDLAPDDGSVSAPKRARIAGVAQEAPAGETSLIDTVLEADTERASLMTAAETETDPHRIAEIQTRLADIEAHSAPARAAQILAGLGFSNDDQQQPCSAFSGGWRMRVALAAVLFSQPDILLLDEPTNYLDLEGTIWLESYLQTYPYTVLLVSHDRGLLNRAVAHILHLDKGKLTLYGGGYDTFDKTRRMKLEQQLAMKSKQEAARRHMQEFVDRFRYKASKARQAQSRLKMLEKMEPIAAMVEDRVAPFTFADPKPLPPPLVRMEDVAVGYEPGKPVLSGIDLRLDQDDRVALLGANGNGKSTFAKLLAGRLNASDGRLLKSKKVKTGYFAQHQLDELNPKETPFEHLQGRLPDLTQAQIRARLGTWGFGADKADVKAGNLSGGEKARLLLHLCTLTGPDIFILDEPTNHLDVDSREALIQALNQFSGGVILISHDRHLIEACADRLWLVADGTVKPYDGDMDDYRKLLLGKDRKKAPAANSSNSDQDAGTKKDTRRASAAKRDALAPLKKQAKSAEKEIARLQAALARIDRELADPSLFADRPDQAADLSRQRSQTIDQIEQAELLWLEASERYETAIAESS